MPKHETLVNLLRVITEEWRPDEVRSAFIELGHEWENESWEKAFTNRSQKKRKPKPSATELVERLKFDSETKSILTEIARRYDEKAFLPGTADVREFIFLLGERPKAMRDRSEAFRILLESLVRLPFDRLKHVQQKAEHSGPSQLGPLSDAISVASTSIRRAPSD